jgi:hypothetical protein
MPDPKFNNAEHNAEVAAKQAAQDLSGQSQAPEASEDTSSALDNIRKAAQEKAAAAAETPAVEPKETADPKEGEPAATPPAADPVVPAEGTPPAAAPAAPPKDEAATKRAEELFKGSPTLPPNASPKSTEAFATIKIKAAQEVSRLEQKLAEVEKANAELTTKLKDPVPPEVLKELEDHRKFRAKLDVDLDPKFKEFDKAVTSAEEFIYAQLKKSPVVTEAVIADIKKYGGPENVNMTKIFDAIKDPTIQRLVETKIADIAQQKFNKERAISDAKTNISEYLKEREETFKKSTVSHTNATKAEFAKILPSIEWMKEKSAPAGADEATVKSVKEHNAFVVETRRQLDEALADDSPEMRAIMLTGMAQLFNTQRELAAIKAANESIKKELEQANTMITRLKSSNRSRLPESGAPTGQPASQPKPKEDYTTPAGDALDAIRKQVVDARKAALA